MFSEEFNDVLCLLAITIFADKRVFAQEIEAFLKGSQSLESIYKMDEKVSEARLLMWFESNNSDIRQKILTPDFEPWFNRLLNRLNRIEDKQPILDIMNDIAWADKDYHVSEKALNVLTTGHWGLQAQL